ncbi:MAG TPA: type VI secretion system tube protein Hcp [Actinomycetes bacterium]
MGAHLEPSGTSRRDVLKTGAVGMGALLGAMGMGGVASASPAAQAVGAIAGVSGAVDYFLKLDGVAGESTDAKHPGEIQLLSFSWGASNPSRAAAGGRNRAGRPTISDFSFMSSTSTASPRLFADCVTGKNHATAVITGVRAGEQTSEFLKITLTDVLVSSYQSSASSEIPTDSTSLSFRAIKYTITPQDPTGQPGTPVTGSWDVARNATG